MKYRFVSYRLHVFACVLPIVLAASAASAAPPAPASAESNEYFEKRVRPLLADKCFGCHGPAATGANGGLRMLGREELIKGGSRGPAIVPSHPESSLLIHAVSYVDPRLAMPPRARLTDDEIALLTDWIRKGAPWPNGKPVPSGIRTFNLKARRDTHWAWQPIHRTSPPAVRPGQRAWAASSIDAFILSGLNAKGLSPAPPADRRTLIRRLSYDLIGLPPSPAEVKAFVEDRSPDAYARVVDRLLASPHYGERWARHWLDLVRYAETDGHEFDLEKPGAWQYRDYVIRALNADVNYKQFAMEQLAGDLIPNPRLNPDLGFNESILGTGFYWLGSGTHSPVDLLDDQADHMDNEIDVLSKTFLGIGVGCARCHDHKFDAVSQKDYYGLFGILASTRRQIVSVGRPPDPELIKRISGVQSEISAAAVASSRKALSALTGSAASQWKPAMDAAKSDPASPLYALASVTDAPPDAFAARFAEAARRVEEQQSRSARDVAGIEWFVKDSVHATGFPEWSATGKAFPGVDHGSLDVRLAMDGEPHVASALCASIADSGLVSDRLHGSVRSRTFVIDKNRVIYRMAGHGAHLRFVIDGLLQLRDPLYGELSIEPNSDSMKWYSQDLSRWIGHRAYIELQDIDSGYIALDRVGFTNGGEPANSPNDSVVELLKHTAAKDPAALAAAFRSLFQSALDAAGRGSADSAGMDLATWAVKWSPLDADTRLRLQALEKSKQELEKAISDTSPAMAAADGTGNNERVHMRGNYRTPGVEAPRRFLEACDGPLNFATEPGCGRLELAERITAPSDPLFARVMVNRLWQHHFGEGIVRTPDDFGFMGQRPTNPQLLDWLASEFIQQGWSIKKMQRIMVMTNAYKMDSRSNAKAEAADPQNLLLHRMPIRRLEAECIRDGILAVSGRLDPAVCGPPVMPNLNSYTPGRGAPPSGPVDGAGRRSIYISVRRGFPVPMLSAFDLPVPMTTMGKRGVSAVPAQALALLNDPFVVEQAAIWAKQVTATPGTPDQRIRSMYERAFARDPADSELAAAAAFIAQRTRASGNPDDPAAWSDLCHVLFNLKEFIFVR